MTLYDRVRVADAALGNPDAEQTATALNAQTVTMPPQNIATSDARSVVLQTGEWGAICLACISTTAPASLVGAAIVARDTLTLTDTLNIGDSGIWSATSALLSALNTAGILSAATVARLTAMRTPVVPLWPVVLTAADITSARAGT